jgi:hypothetical protein
MAFGPNFGAGGGGGAGALGANGQMLGGATVVKECFQILLVLPYKEVVVEVVLFGESVPGAGGAGGGRRAGANTGSVGTNGTALTGGGGGGAGV